MLFQATDDHHDLAPGHPDRSALRQDADSHRAAATAGLAALGLPAEGTLASFVAWAGSW